jgi:AraC-like DNA-binding protein
MNSFPFDRLVLNAPPRYYLCPRDWSCDLRIPDHDLWVVLSGRGEIRIDGTPLPVCAPQAILLRPGNHVLGRHDPAMPLEVFALHFTPFRRVKDPSWHTHLQAIPLGVEAEFFRMACQRLVAEYARADEVGNQAAETLALALLHAVWRRAEAPTEAPHADRLETLLREIRHQPEKPWDVATLARRVGLGATRLNEAFRARTGYSPAAWIIRCRLARAEWLLRETDLKLASIAEACGYSDVYFFCRQFRRFLGESPGKWRQKYRHAPPKRMACKSRDDTT